MDIRGEHLDLWRVGTPSRLLEQEHPDRIRLLPGRAADRPYPHLFRRRFTVEETGNDMALEGAEHGRITEETRDVDQQIVKQCAGFATTLAHQLEILIEGLYADHLHPSRDATRDGRPLVSREILTGAHPHDGENLLHRVRAFGAWTLLIARRNLRLGPREAGDVSGHLRDRRHDVNDPRVDGAPRHAVVLRLCRVLHQHETAALANVSDAFRAVGAGSRENHADRCAVARFGQRAEEMVDRRTPETIRLHR